MGKKGVYVSKKEIFNKQKNLMPLDFVASGDANHLYLDLSKHKTLDIIRVNGEGKVLVNGGNKGDLYIKLFIGDYEIKGDSVYNQNEPLTEAEYQSMKKITLVEGKKIVTPITKMNEYLLIGNYGLLNFKGEPMPLYIMIKREEN